MKCFIMSLLVVSPLVVIIGCTGHSDVNIPPSVIDMLISGRGGYAPPMHIGTADPSTAGPVGGWLGTVPTENKPDCPTNVWDGDMCITTPGFGSL